MIWAGILLASLGCYVLKALGLAVPERALEVPAVRRIGALLPIALLAALVGVQAFADGPRLVLDARAAGLGTGVIAVLLRAPFLVVVGVAAATAALLRALPW